MMSWIPVVCAFLVVGGTCSFIVYCLKGVDAEEERVLGAAVSAGAQVVPQRPTLKRVPTASGHT